MDKLSKTYKPILELCGKICRSKRNKYGINQKKISDDLGVTKAVISRFEHGKNNNIIILLYYIMMDEKFDNNILNELSAEVMKRGL